MKLRILFFTLCIVVLVPAGISFITALLNVFYIIRISDIFDKISIVIILLISPLAGTVLGYIYFIKRIQIKMKLLFGFVYFILAFILALISSGIGFTLIFNAGATIS